jgi:hypothetical protein
MNNQEKRIRENIDNELDRLLSEGDILGALELFEDDDPFKYL